MECFSAILLFDAFSARKRNRVVHWITVTAVAFLDATLLNFAATTMPNYSKIVIAFALYFFMHRLLYTSNGMFSFYISIVFYSGPFIAETIVQHCLDCSCSCGCSSTGFG